MKTSVHSPIAIHHETCYGEELVITWFELEEAEVGREWSIEDQDQYPNRSCSWTVTYRIVYRDDKGILVRVEEDGKTVELMWFDLN